MNHTERPRLPDVPRNAWYCVASSDEVGRQPLRRRVHGEGVVLYRTTTGEAVALADRCVHRPYPLSLGHLEGDAIVSGYSGFVYGPDGVVRSVPTQPSPPVGARVHAYPTHEDAGMVWLWTGEPGTHTLHQVPGLPWLTGAEWTTFGDAREIAAHPSLLQDWAADITHLANVDQRVAPPVLASEPPQLHVEVSERRVRFWRDYGPERLQDWQAEVLELDPAATHPQHEEGLFLAPGLWVDRWDILVNGHGDRDGTHTLYFTHAFTPVDERTTRHAWFVSRSFASSARATGTMKPLLSGYYDRVREVLETMQRVIDEEGIRREVNVVADAAVVQVRKIMRRLAAEERR